MIASIDWAHTKPLSIHLDGESHEVVFKDIITFIKEHDIDTVVGENIPSKILLALLEHNIKIFRCSGTTTADYRKQNNLEKESDSLDARYILEVYSIHPELFYEYTEKDKIFLRAKHLYKLRDNIQITRIQYELKINACKNFFLVDDDIIDKLSSIHKELYQKEVYLDTKFKKSYFKKYIDLFNDVNGLGGIGIGYIISEIGDINRFKNIKSFLNYAFGYNGSHHNHRLKTRLLMTVDDVFRHKNKYYLELYHKYKETLKNKHPEKIKQDSKTKYNPAHLSRLAKRRVAREIAVLIYKRIKCYSEIDTGLPLNKNHDRIKTSIVNLMEA